MSGLSEQQLAAIRTALTHQAPATDEQVRAAVSDALSTVGHNYQPLINERLRRADGHVPAIVRRLLDAESERDDLKAKYVDAAATVAEQALKSVERAKVEHAVRDELEVARAAAAAFEPLHLGDPTVLVSHRCVNPTHPMWLTVGRADRRGCPWCRLAELDRLQPPVGQTVFLADYDGAEDGPKLFASLDAAQAWVADWSTGDGTWDWFERDGVWEQWGTDPDSDRPAGRGAGTVTPLTVPMNASAEQSVYRAAHPDSGITLGHYTSAKGAREHCEALMLRERPDAGLDWIEDEDDGISELVAEVGDQEVVTGYIVTALVVASAYDPDGDE